MSRKVCPIQDLCPKFDIGLAMKDHWHRYHTPCISFLDMSCAMSFDLQLFLGDKMACDIDKIKRLNERVRTAPPESAERETK